MMRMQKLESLGQPGHPVGRDSKDTGLLSECLGLSCPTHFPTHRRLRSSFISSFRILFSSLSPFISLAAKSVVISGVMGQGGDKGLPQHQRGSLTVLLYSGS